MPTVTQYPLTLPPAEPPRDTYFCIRMSTVEKAALHALAKRLNTSASTLARHFLNQAVQHFSQNEWSRHEPSA
ncbi:MAG: hypothetical protein LCI00_07970 [Chloroflexi bacterium]|nr:hypothetical protein [Chloroflexota bacterium]